jgi:hypothetical protein
LRRCYEHRRGQKAYGEAIGYELHDLRKNLESQGERIQSQIASYTELAQGAMQLTTINSDNLKNLSAGPTNASR